MRSLEFLYIAFFSLHTFSVILYLWNYRKQKAETPFNKIGATSEYPATANHYCFFCAASFEERDLKQ